MSIIHDALKKVQQNLSSNAGETPVSQPAKDQPASSYIYATPPAGENVTQTDGKTGQQAEDPKSTVQNKIKSILALACAIAITAISIFFIYQQIKSNIPRVGNLAQRSFFQLMHKKDQLALKPKAPADLKPLAQLTLNPATAQTTTAAKPPAPVTLNIHGIMSNTTGNLVLINDQVYQEGDDVDGAKIVKIDLDSITIVNNGIEQTIPVKN